MRCCDMEEDGGAVARNNWVGVPAQDAGDVVDGIVAPKGFVPAGIGQGDGFVVGAVRWVVAPAIIGGDGFEGDGAAGRFDAVCPVENAQEWE